MKIEKKNPKNPSDLLLTDGGHDGPGHHQKGAEGEGFAGVPQAARGHLPLHCLQAPLLLGLRRESLLFL